MAFISTLRDKLGPIVVGAVGVSMIAFIVGTDLFGSGPKSLFGSSENTVAEISGNEISFETYSQAIQAREASYFYQFGRQPGDRERVTLEAQAWEMLVLMNAIEPEYKKLGIQVTKNELKDMVMGKNIEENIKNSFLDSAGNFSRSRLIAWLQDPANEATYRMFEADLVPARLRIKYENLLNKTVYVTEAESELDYHAQNDVIEAKYLYVPFSAVGDSVIKVTDADIQNYYNKNKQRFKSQNTRSMKYVIFPVVPSADDSLAVQQDLNRMANDFKTSTEDSLFAAANSIGQRPYAKYSVASLPTPLSNMRGSLSAGTVIGPVADGDLLKIFKVTKVEKDTTFNARASHILIKWEDTTAEKKKAAKDKARKILAEIKAGASFADKAREFGEDGTATRGGDLGWFTNKQMVKPFSNAVFGATRSGLISDVVETEFGYHIIDVTGAKENTAYWIATIEQNVTPSDATNNTSLRKADSFVGSLKSGGGVKRFEDLANRDTLTVLEANDIPTTEQRLNGVGEARQIITWLFREGEVGKVSQVFSLQDANVVAVMTGEVEKGFEPLNDDLKQTIRNFVKNELAGKYIADKLKGQTGTLEDLAKPFGPTATMHLMSDLKLNATMIPGPGLDPLIVGGIFSTESGKRSRPVIGDNGVVMADVQNKTIAAAMGDYSMFKNQLLQTQMNRSSYFVTEALRDAANINDLRYKFF